MTWHVTKSRLSCNQVRAMCTHSYSLFSISSHVPTLRFHLYYINAWRQGVLLTSGNLYVWRSLPWRSPYMCDCLYGLCQSHLPVQSTISSPVAPKPDTKRQSHALGNDVLLRNLPISLPPTPSPRVFWRDLWWALWGVLWRRRSVWLWGDRTLCCRCVQLCVICIVHSICHLCI